MPTSVDAGNRYVLHEPLGRGGMAVVHRATMVGPAGQRRVAVKRLLVQEEKSADARERIVAEARLVFQLTHANICQVLDLASGEDGTFIIMEFVDGIDLETLLRHLQRDDQASMEIPLAVYIAREVTRALDYAHRRSADDGSPLFLVHGDVSPRNILLSREGEVKLADFGLARALGTLAPGNHLRGGTLGFTAPEAMSGHGMVDHRADIYSLGMCLCAALVGDSRRGESGLALLQQQERVPRQLLSIIERAIERRREDRFVSAGELEQALTLHLAHQYPSFLPSTLAIEVRKYAMTPSSSSSLKDVTRPSLVSVFQQASQISVPAPRTRQLHGGRPKTASSRWRNLALLGGGLAAAGLLAVFATTTLSASSATRTTTPQPPTTTPSVLAPAPTLEKSPSLAAVPTPTPTPAREPRTAHSRGTVKKAVGYITVNSSPWGAVYVDGKQVAESTPASRLPVRAGVHRVTVFNPGRNRHSPAKSVSIEAGAEQAVGFLW